MLGCIIVKFRKSCAAARCLSKHAILQSVSVYFDEMLLKPSGLCCGLSNDIDSEGLTDLNS